MFGAAARRMPRDRPAGDRPRACPPRLRVRPSQERSRVPRPGWPPGSVPTPTLTPTLTPAPTLAPAPTPPSAMPPIRAPPRIPPPSRTPAPPPTPRARECWSLRSEPRSGIASSIRCSRLRAREGVVRLRDPARCRRPDHTRERGARAVPRVLRCPSRASSHGTCRPGVRSPQFSIGRPPLDGAPTVRRRREALIGQLGTPWLRRIRRAMSASAVIRCCHAQLPDIRGRAPARCER